MREHDAGGADTSGGAPPHRYDLVLKGGRVLDPSQNLDLVGDVAIHGGKIAAIESNIERSRTRREINVAGLLVCPGLIDLHVHTNLFRNPEALDPDSMGVYNGVTRIVDAGDVGCYTWQGYRKSWVETTKTKLHNWIAAPGLGGPLFGLYNTDVILHPSLIDVDATVQLIEMYPDIIRGVKFYGTPEVWGNPDGTEVFRKAFQICELARVPAYMHSGMPLQDGGMVYGGKPVLFGEEVNGERVLAKALEMMRPGDILAHPYSCFNGTPWNPKEKRLNAGVKEAYDRGIIFDSARGAHFVYDYVRNLLDHGILPTTISTDQHSSDQHDEWGRVANYGMCVHMSEWMAFGLSLEEVVLRSTYTPAKALRLTHKAGSLKVGRAADITVMVLREGTFKFRDNPYAFGTPEYMESNRLLSPVITLLDGQVYPCNPAFLPDLGNLQVQEDVWTWMGQRPQRSTEYRLAGEE